MWYHCKQTVWELPNTNVDSIQSPQMRGYLASIRCLSVPWQCLCSVLWFRVYCSLAAWASAIRVWFSVCRINRIIIMMMVMMFRVMSLQTNRVGIAQYKFWQHPISVNAWLFGINSVPQSSVAVFVFRFMVPCLLFRGRLGHRYPCKIFHLPYE